MSIELYDFINVDYTKYSNMLTTENISDVLKLIKDVKVVRVSDEYVWSKDKFNELTKECDKQISAKWMMYFMNNAIGYHKYNKDDVKWINWYLAAYDLYNKV